MKRKILMILILIFLLILLLIMLFVINGIKIIDNSDKRPDTVSITIYDSSTNNFNQSILNDKEQINEIFNILKNTKKETFHFYKKDDEPFQHNREFVIQLCYSSGKIETIEATERYGRIFKNKRLLFFNGYVKGDNEMIWNYIKEKKNLN